MKKNSSEESKFELNKDKLRQLREKLSGWYQTNQRKLPWRESKNPYHIWLSEVMLQQTQVKTVLPYYFKFLESFPSIHDLAHADLERVLKLWEGLGYYARARNFHKAAGLVVNQFNGRIPETFETFIRFPGVGDYIGSAVQSLAFGHPHAVVDGNVKRVLSRLFLISDPVNRSSSHRAFKMIAETILDRKDPGTFNQALMELGALICTPRQAKCTECPLTAICEALVNQIVDQYPKRIKTPRVPTHRIAVGVVKKNGKMLITRRKLDGLLGGLWEFPGGKLKKEETPRDACSREIKEETGLCVTVEKHLTTVHHAYTHFKIQMDVFYCRHIEGRVRLTGPIDHRWITLSEIENFAFPKANNKFIPLLDASD